MARTQLGRRRRGRDAGTLDRAVTALAGLCSALNDPANLVAQLAVASLLLVAETVLCLLIIRRVPCEPETAAHAPLAAEPCSRAASSARSACRLAARPPDTRACHCDLADTEIDWVAYMQEVGGYLEVSHEGLRLCPPLRSRLADHARRVKTKPWQRRVLVT